MTYNCISAPSARWITVADRLPQIGRQYMSTKQYIQVRKLSVAIPVYSDIEAKPDRCPHEENGGHSTTPLSYRFIVTSDRGSPFPHPMEISADIMRNTVGMLKYAVRPTPSHANAVFTHLVSDKYKHFITLHALAI